MDYWLSLKAYGTLMLQSRLMSITKGVLALKIIIRMLLTMLVGIHLLKIFSTWGTFPVLMPNGKWSLVVVVRMLGFAFCILTGVKLAGSKSYPNPKNICSIQHYLISSPKIKLNLMVNFLKCKI